MVNMGLGVFSSKIFAISSFSAFSITRFASLPEKGGTLSCNFASSSAISSGSKSFLVEIVWPNFTNIGPSSSKVFLILSPLDKEELLNHSEGKKILKILTNHKYLKF